MSSIKGILAAITFVALLTPIVVEAQAPGRITGVGGVFVTSKDPKALAAWYRDVLGISLEPWGGAVMRYDAPGSSPHGTLECDAGEFRGDCTFEA